MDKIMTPLEKKKKMSKSEATIGKNTKTGEKKSLSAKGKNIGKSGYKKSRGTVYLGSIPHGFYEKEMISYFSQFGKVLSATVARSKRTGKSKGYAFVEFADENVAKIAAETMNNYLMFNRIIKCKYISSEERKGKRLSEFQPSIKNKILDAKNKNNSVQTMSQEEFQKRTKKKLVGMKKFFDKKGIDFPVTGNKNGTNQVQSKTSVKSVANITISSVSTINVDTKSDLSKKEDFGVLEVDESDEEIQFVTPPHVKKVFKKSGTPAPTQKKKLLKGKGETKINQNKKKKPHFSSKSVSVMNVNKHKKTSKSTPSKVTNAVSLHSVRSNRGIKQKFEKKALSREKSLKKSFKTKCQDQTVKALHKGVAAMLEQSGGKINHLKKQTLSEKTLVKLKAKDKTALKKKCSTKKLPVEKRNKY